MIVCGIPFTLMARPTTDGSEAYRVRHTSSLNITTGSAPGRSSAAVKSRPSTGRSPVIPKSVHETVEPRYRVGSPAPSAIVRLRPVNAPNASSVVFESRMSLKSWYETLPR